ncbi:hypothetical protein KR044_012283 [Drosophila immigrans]|nr:hypothetical protein KR044_012283 [Drosophila immigrans]
MFNVRLTFLVIVLIGSSGFQLVPADYVTTALIKSVLSGDDMANIVFSPYLVRESLMQLYLGADGTTAKQIEDALQLSTDMSKKKIINDVIKSVPVFKNPNFGQLKKASRLYVANKNHVTQLYEEKYAEYFNASVGEVDFGDPESKKYEIKDWLRKMTSVQMLKGINELTKETQAMQIGAMYFRAKFKKPFHVNDTRAATFYRPTKTGGYKAKKVYFMTRKGKYQYAFIEQLNAYTIEIPYEHPALTLIILLPKAMDGVKQMIAKLDKFNLNDLEPHEMISNFRILLPKFKLGKTVSVKQALQSLGIKDLFENANLEGMTNKSDFKIDDILQKTYIEVDEGSSRAEIDS